ncbi:hypothetical protein [Nocardia brasiliensis]|uniref:hypothetical protein n=1 Tax=Nocardia brasiliensis TaxID=37326 RepID=UPI002454CF8B|nr:hypothetical protein [Nocardia brasiliensis]
MSTETNQNDVRKTNVTLSRRKRRDFKRLMLDWEEDNDFPIELKESHCLEAAVELIIRASNPELISQEAKDQKLNAEATKELEAEYDWFMGKFMDILREIVSSRISTDKRRASPFQ